MSQSTQVNTDDGLSLHVEQTGPESAPNIILIPSGEGDCHSYSKVTSLLAPTFRVTAFDMPGFSRSVPSPSAFKDLTAYVIAKQVISLMDKLSIASATIFGASSGALVAIALLQEHEKRIERIIIHEAPMNLFPHMREWAALPESQAPMISGILKDVFANVMIEDRDAWLSLGPEYHTRLEKNYVTWIQNYAPVVEGMRWSKEDFTRLREKVHWSLGGQMPLAQFFGNAVFATEVGIKITLLDCKHFPYVSIPEKFVEYVKGCAV